MSRMIPGQLVKLLRQITNLSVDLNGIDCHLYVPKNSADVENTDVYGVPTDFSFDEYDTKVWIEWTPNKSSLQKYGIYAEETLPIIAYFKNKIEDISGFAHETPVHKRSWFTIPVEFIPETYDTDKFEIVDVLIPKMHDAVVLKAYKVAPKRTKTS